jgi:leucyl aminopeptidase (aminopeptidase T)
MLHIGARLEKILKNSREVEVYSKSGTSLKFSVAGRKWLIDDGVISDGDVERGDVILNLPTGEVFIAPVENSVNGVFVMDTPRYYKGQKIAGLKLTFKNGKLVDFKAQKGENIFKELLETNTGDKDKFAEFGIGINADAELNAPLILEEKALGTIHVAIGDNRTFGGKNNSTLHIDLISVNPTVKIEGKTIMVDGKLQV